MKAEADYDRQKSYIAGKAEEEGKAVSSVASEEKEDEEKHWPRLQVEGIEEDKTESTENQEWNPPLSKSEDEGGGQL